MLANTLPCSIAREYGTRRPHGRLVFPFLSPDVELPAEFGRRFRSRTKLRNGRPSARTIEFVTSFGREPTTGGSYELRRLSPRQDRAVSVTDPLP